MFFTGVLNNSVGGGWNLPVAKAYHVSMKLQDGRILSMMGTSDMVNGNTSAYLGTEVGNTISWIATTVTLSPIVQPSSSILLDGRITFFGGRTSMSAGASVYAYAGTVTGNSIAWAVMTAPITSVRQGAQVTLPDGRILLIGGATSNLPSSAIDFPQFGVVNVNTISWSTGTGTSLLPSALYGHTATLLPDGRVVVIGGFNSTGTATNTCYIGTVVNDLITWVVSDALPNVRADHTTTLLPDGRLAIVGGSNGSSAYTSVFTGTIAGNVITWVSNSSVLKARAGSTANLLPSGRLFVCGGTDLSTGSKTDVFVASTSTTFSWLNHIKRFFDDIVGILTGSITSSVQLSTNFASASFINTVPPGWSIHDAAAGASANGITPTVIKALWSDDATKSKYVYLGSFNETHLLFNGFETWDSTTHTGTNPIVAVPVVESFQDLLLSPNLQVTISASSKGFYIQLSANLISVATSYTCVSEYTRDDPWSTVASGYPSWLQCGLYQSVASSAQGGIPRMYSPSIGSDVTSVPFNTSNSAITPGLVLPPNGLVSQTNLSVPYASAGYSALGGMNRNYSHLLTTTVGADSAKITSKYLYEIALRQLNPVNSPTLGVFLGGSVSLANPSLYYVGGSVGYVGDSLFVGANEYLLTGSILESNIRIAIRKA